MVWKVTGQSAVDLTGLPGQQVTAEMVGILAAFPSVQHREVVPLLRPKPGVAVDPEVLVNEYEPVAIHCQESFEDHSWESSPLE